MIFKMIQKKKGNTSTSKKLNRIKSENVMPIGTLMQEIGELREELKGIKRGRRQDISSQIKKIEKNHENKENNVKKEFCHELCESLSKEVRLKLQILWGKICKGLSLTDEEKVKSQVLQLIELFNSESQETKRQINDLKQQLEETIRQRDMERRQESEKYWIIAENNKRLESEVEELKVNTIAIISQKQQKMDQIVQEYESQKEVLEQLKLQLQQLTRTNIELQSLIQEWESQCKKLQEKCSVFEKQLLSKDHEIKMMQEDVRYLRIESEKFKSQKNQFQKLWEKSSVDIRQFKRAFEEEVVKAQREKNKWMNECELRRHQSEQIHAIESQKEVIFKEVQDLRSKYSLKCKQLSETKALLHQLQRKLITIQGDHFRMTNELEKTQRENQYWETEMTKLRKEFEEYSELETKVKKKEPIKKTKSEKMMALDDIHSLIKQFRSDDDI